MKLINLPNNYFTSIDDFILSQQYKPLGSGSFGIVYKAYHKITNKIYAIKIIQINSCFTQSEILLLTRQISIHYQLDHPHIIKLWSVIEENNKIYMIMDYAQNGNLFTYINKKNIFNQSQSFKIFYQILNAIQYMHKLDVFHRDIKPENILLDHQMNAKLCDFGWVADQINRKRVTFCGTYEYMAPQMVQEIPYDYKVDIWALGVLLYELNHGRAPFPAQSVQKIKQQLQKKKYEIKDKLSEQLKQLITNILQFDPQQRYRIEDIKSSKWIESNKKINQQQIKKKWQQNKSCSFQKQKKQKKYHNKYKTLNQQDLNKQIQKNNNLQIKNISKNKSNKNYHKYVSSKQSLCNFKQNKCCGENSKYKKFGNKRTHTFVNTENNQFFCNNGVYGTLLPSKIKIVNMEQKKKKNLNKKN